MSRLPSALWAGFFWARSRSQWIRDIGQLPICGSEAVLLIKQMVSARPDRAASLKAISPC